MKKIFSLFILGIAVLGYDTVYGCLCVPYNPQSRLSESEVVFIGEIVSIVEEIDVSNFNSVADIARFKGRGRIA